MRSASDLEAFSRESPGDMVRLNDRAHAIQRVVGVLLMTGELNRAQESADEAIVAFDRLTGYDEGNIEWRRSSTSPRIAKGFALTASGQLDEALGLANQCISVLEINNCKRHGGLQYITISRMNRRESQFALTVTME